MRMLVLMLEYMYTGPTALRDLRTTEQLESSALFRATRRVTYILAPVWLETGTPGSHSCIHQCIQSLLYPLRHASHSLVVCSDLGDLPKFWYENFQKKKKKHR